VRELEFISKLGYGPLHCCVIPSYALGLYQFLQNFFSNFVAILVNRSAGKYLLCFWRDSPQWARTSSFTRLLDNTQWRTTVGRTSLDEWSARRRDLYLTTHNTHNKHPCPRWDSNPRSQLTSGRRLKVRPHRTRSAAADCGLWPLRNVTF